jgi:hypothetical protein
MGIGDHAQLTLARATFFAMVSVREPVLRSFGIPPAGLTRLPDTELDGRQPTMHCLPPDGILKRGAAWIVGIF